MRENALDPVLAPAIRRDALIAVGCTAASLVAYLLTMYPELPGGDSGELIAAAATGGVIHPPGSPLYALLGRAFAHLSVGTLAWRFNLLSGISDAGAAAVLFLAVARWSGSRWAGGAAAAVFAFSPLVWLYAISAELFALNNLFVALLLWMAVLYEQTHARRYALLGAFLFGLGFSNHQTIVFTGVPLSIWVLWTGRRELWTPRNVILLSVFFAAGLLPYLYLPVAGGNNVPVTWGDTQTWPGFWTHVLRSEYGTLRLSVAHPAQTDFIAVVSSWLYDLAFQFTWPGIGLACIGVGWICFRGRSRIFSSVAMIPPVLAVLVFSLFGNLPVADPLQRGILARFWQQPELYACAWVAFGFLAIGRRVRWGPLVPAMCVAIAVAQLVFRFVEMDRHTNRLVYSYGAEILRAAPPETLMVTKGDLITNSVRYLQLAEGRRLDVKVVDQELLAFRWYRHRLEIQFPNVVFPGDRLAAGSFDGFSLLTFFNANAARFPILVCGGMREDDPTAATQYRGWPLGLCEIMHRKDESVAVEQWIQESEEALPRIDFTGQARPPGSWEAAVWSDTWASRQWRSLALMDLAGRDPTKRGYIEMAAAGLQEILNANPDPPPQIIKSLAIAYSRLGPQTPAERERAMDLWRRYLRVAPATDPQIRDIEELVRKTSP
jgi:hypothetical protein